jgi:hypothetical protein
MSDIERGSGEQHPDLDEFVDDWDEAEPESKPSRWSRLTRGRPAMPLMAAGCVGVLVILIGIVIGGQVGSDSETPPSSGSGPSAEAPPIDFVPVGDGEEETSHSHRGSEADHRPDHSEGDLRRRGRLQLSAEHDPRLPGGRPVHRGR